MEKRSSQPRVAEQGERSRTSSEKILMSGLGRVQRMFRSWRLVLEQARYTTCALFLLLEGVVLFDPRRCNDRLFPSTAISRADGDKSFTPKPLSRGCCGSAPDHEHATSTSAFHDLSFEPQVLLIDAACEWEDYAADITRTMPIGNGGRFTERAGEIYELVLKMQKVSGLASLPT